MSPSAALALMIRYDTAPLLSTFLPCGYHLHPAVVIATSATRMAIDQIARRRESVRLNSATMLPVPSAATSAVRDPASQIPAAMVMEAAKTIAGAILAKPSATNNIKAK